MRGRLIPFVVAVLVLFTIGVACGGNGGSSSHAAALKVGDAAPAFTLPSADGGRVSPSDFQGRPILFYFSMGPG